MRLRTDFVLSAALCAVVLALTPVGLAQKGKGGGGGGGGTPPPDRIVFRRHLGGNDYQLFTMRSNGTQQTQITFAGGGYTFATDPEWLPDGRILFGRGTAGRGVVGVANADGTGFQEIAEVPDYWFQGYPLLNNNAYELAVSPGGEFASFSLVNGGTPHAAYVVRTDGAGAPVLAAGMNEGGDVIVTGNWSPDLGSAPGYQGKLLVCHTEPELALYAVDIYDDGNGNPVVGGAELVLANATYAKWSPDGRRLAMIDSGGRPGNWSGYTLMAIDIPTSEGQPQFPLSPAARYVVATTPSGPGGYERLNWKPDSESLVSAFRFSNSGYFDVCTVAIPPVGGGSPGTVVRLTTNKAWEGRGSWSLPLWP